MKNQAVLSQSQIGNQQNQATFSQNQAVLSQNQPLQQQKTDQDEPSLGEFFNSGELSDLVVVDTNGQKIKKYNLHKVILASKSSYFRKLLKDSPNEKEIVLPTLIKLDIQSDLKGNLTSQNNQYNEHAKEINVVESTLKFIYSDYDFSILTNEGLNSLNCLNFFSFFSSLKVNSGLFLMEKYILQYILKNETCLQILKIGLQFENQSFIDNSIRLISEKFSRFLKHVPSFYEQLLDLPYEGFKNIIAQNDIHVDSEDIIIQIVHDYIVNKNSNNNYNKNNQLDHTNQTNHVIDHSQLQNNPIPQSISLPKTDDITATNLSNAQKEEGQGGVSNQNKNSLNKPENSQTANSQPNQVEEVKQIDENKESQKAVTKEESVSQLPEGEKQQNDQGDNKEPPSTEEKKAEQEQNVNSNIQPENQANQQNMSLTVQSESHKVSEKNSISANINSKYEVLNESKIDELLKQVRLGYVSHSVLTHFSQQEIFKQFREIFYKAISLKLTKYELNTVPNYQDINWNPREHYLNRITSLNPTVIETQHNIQQSSNRNSNKTFNDQAPIHSNLSPYPSSIYQQEEGYIISSPKANFFSQSHQSNEFKFVKPNQSRSLAFTYTSDFDENGLFYYLGTKNRTIGFINPFYLNEVMPFCSSLKNGRIEDLSGRLTTNTICSQNEKNSFFGFDLGEERFFFPTCYTIRNRSTPSTILYNWVIEGSNDNQLWHEIDKRIHFSKDSKYNLLLEKERELLRKPNQSSTWGIDTAKLKTVLHSISLDTVGFRAFRITQLSVNGNNTHEFAIGAIEFYGKGYGINWEL